MNGERILTPRPSTSAFAIGSDSPPGRQRGELTPQGERILTPRPYVPANAMPQRAGTRRRRNQPAPDPPPQPAGRIRAPRRRAHRRLRLARRYRAPPAPPPPRYQMNPLMHMGMGGMGLPFNIPPPRNIWGLPQPPQQNPPSAAAGRRILTARRRQAGIRRAVPGGSNSQTDMALQQALWQSAQPRTPNASQVQNLRIADNDNEMHEPLADPLHASLEDPEEPDRKRAKLELGCCPICLDELGSKPLSVTKCGHIFCTECVRNRHVTRCPKCRKSLRGSGAVHSLFL